MYAIRSYYAQSFSCTYTGILTIKEGKILCEFVNINYQQFIPSHYSSDSWVPDRTINIPLDTLYPVYKHPTEEWEPTWELFKVTNKAIPDLVYSLSGYLQNYKQNNDF